MTDRKSLVTINGTTQQVPDGDNLIVGAGIVPVGSTLTVGGAAVTTDFPGPVTLTGDVTTVGGTTFTTSATFEGDVTFGTDGGPDGPDTISFVAAINSNMVFAGTSATTGTATAGGASTLTDGGATWTVDAFKGNVVQITAGTGIGQTRVITTNSATVLTVTPAWATQPDNTSVYDILTEAYLLRNVADPVLPQDAATRAYVDAASGAATLQTAYVNGNTITTSAPEGDVTINGTEDFVVGGTVDVSITSTGGISGTAMTGAVTLQTTAAVTLQGGAASSIATTAGDLTLDAQAASLVLDGGEAAVDAVRIVASDAAGGIDVDAGTGGITLDSTGAVSIDAAAASNFTTSSGALTLTSAAAATWSTVTGDLNLTASTNSVVITGAEAAVDAITLTASNAAGGIDLNAGTGGVTLDTTGAFSIDAAAASNVSVTGADLTLSTITSGAVNLTAAGNFQISANGNATTWPTAAGAANTFLKNNGAGALSWSAVNLTTDVTGVLPVANGGTNASSWTQGSVIFAGTGGTSLAQDPTAFFWDASNVRLGLGTNAPLGRLDVATGQLLTDGGSASVPSIAFRTATNTGIFQPAAQQVGIATAGLLRAVVNAGGLVGINTGSPTTTLDVRGDVLAKNTSDSQAAFQVQNAAGTSLLAVNTSDQRVGVGGVAGASLTHTFNVGPSGASNFCVASGGRIHTYDGTAPTNGQVLIGDGTAQNFAKATLTQGTGITITNGAGSITIATSGAGSAAAVEIDMNTSGVSVGAACYVSAAGTVSAASALAPTGPKYRQARVVGIASTSAASGKVVVSGKVSATFVGSLTLTAGDPVYLSLTSGQLTNDVSAFASGDAVAEVGLLTDPLAYNGTSNFTAQIAVQPKSVTIL